MAKAALFFLLCVCLWGNDTFELQALDAQVQEGIVTTDTGAVLLHKGKYFYATSVRYDQDSKEATLQGDVMLIDQNDVSIASDYALVNMDRDTARFVPFYLVDETSTLWIKGGEGEKRGEFYFSQDAITSSCDPVDPDWLIEFSSMEYDAKGKFLDLYNPRLFIKDIPVFYLPYMRVSTNRERKTGLLRPMIGFGGDDGVFYEQPIFIAPSKWWDLQLNPQIRTNRSHGMHANLRFVNSADSEGFISAGYFETKDSYAKEFDLQNKEHTGVQMEYEDANLIQSYDDGLYFHGAWVSDIDYYDLVSKDEASASVTGDMVESKLNYYLTDRNYYFGSYSKHFQDTSKDSNADTLQLLPQTQLHKFSQNLLVDNILYSADFTHSNYTRSEGLTARQSEFSLPITFYTHLFGDYLNFSVSENLYMTHVDFSGGYDSYEYYRNYHEAKLFTDVIKAYDNGYHNMNFGISYTLPGEEKEDEAYEDLSGAQKEIFGITTPAKGYNFYLKQYFYDKNKNEIFHHAFRQPYVYNSDDTREKGEMENILRYKPVSNLQLGVKTYYSHQEDKFSRIQSLAAYRYENFDIRLTHLYRDYFNGKKDKYLTAGAGVEMANYRLFTNLDYDQENSYFKKKVFGVRMNKRCWNWQITYTEDITPSLTNKDSRPEKDQTVMLQFNLKPIGGFAQDIL
ncbi:MAG: LPS-assembly protein LptD [Campylobacterota bacterium]